MKKIFFGIFIFLISFLVFSFIKYDRFFFIPDQFRAMFLSFKFEVGDCIHNDFWAVKNKKILGIRYRKGEDLYLLMDLDRYEQTQLISKSKVEKSILSNCR